MKPSIFGIILILFVAFVFVIDASNLRKRANSSNKCKIKVLTPDDGTIVHHGTTQRATWKPYYCEGTLSVDTMIRVIIIAGSNNTDTWIKVFDELTTFGAEGIHYTVDEKWPSNDFEYVLFAFSAESVDIFGESGVFVIDDKIMQ
ncbi:16094_t:CDS:2 [Cetraspora pellucida]|uniref:16094_t:CDS:1 n=1 Tax=Cetraspora pellucida TaxID=1433469 RepID=A0A9N9F568_9GLOM|nr:16094_t:CDS:2 [Cetraspora pellucida]